MYVQGKGRSMYTKTNTYATYRHGIFKHFLFRFRKKSTSNSTLISINWCGSEVFNFMLYLISKK